MSAKISSIKIKMLTSRDDPKIMMTAASYQTRLGFHLIMNFQWMGEFLLHEHNKVPFPRCESTVMHLFSAIKSLVMDSKENSATFSVLHPGY